MGIFGITSLGAIPFVTFLVDKYGRRRFMLLGYGLMFAGVALVHLRRRAFSVYLSHPPRPGRIVRVLLHGCGHVRRRLRPVRQQGAGPGHIQRVHYCRLRDRPFTRGIHHRACGLPQLLSLLVVFQPRIVCARGIHEGRQFHSFERPLRLRILPPDLVAEVCPRASF